MKVLATILVILFSNLLLTSANLINYSVLPLSITIPNPERGFYVHRETLSTGVYQALTRSDLSNIKAQNNTLILRLYYLHAFLNSDISSTYLSSMQTDFNNVRLTGGIKLILRFAYSNSQTNSGIWDATKAVMLRHIAQLKPLLTSNADVIAVVQAGFIGVWGEWYYTNHFGYPRPTAADNANRREIVDALLDALPRTRMVQIRTVKQKQDMYSRLTPITLAEAFTETTISRLGHHNDCFLQSSTDSGTYTNVTIDYPFLSQETVYLAMGGETCGVNEPRSLCPTATYEMELFHYSYLNQGYERNVLNSWRTGGCYVTIQNRMGYRFELISSFLPSISTISTPFSIRFTINNSGYASLFNKRMVYLVLRNTANNQEFSIPLRTDPRFWFPGQLTVVNESVQLPRSIPTGNYRMFLNLPDLYTSISSMPDYSVRFANNGLWEPRTGYNDLNFTLVVRI